MKNWLKTIILRRLGLSNVIEQIETLKQKIEKLKQEIEKLKQENEILRKDFKTQQNSVDKRIERFKTSYDYAIQIQTKDIQQISNTLRSIAKVGVDFANAPNVEKYGHQSWAVICIEGKQDIVQFYSLNVNEAKDIYRFLNQFSRANIIQDLPYDMPKFKGDMFW